MEELSLTLMQHYGTKGDRKKLEETLNNLKGVHQYQIDMENNHLDLEIEPREITVQHVINEINMKTGFKAF
jgi:copper chaperone CopZ